MAEKAVSLPNFNKSESEVFTKNKWQYKLAGLEMESRWIDTSSVIINQTTTQNQAATDIITPTCHFEETVCICATLSGSAEVKINESNAIEWNSGDINLLYGVEKEKLHLNENSCVQSHALLFSKAYMNELIEQYEPTMRAYLPSNWSSQPFTLFNHNRKMSQLLIQTLKSLHFVDQYGSLGELFLEGKVREIIALMLMSRSNSTTHPKPKYSSSIYDSIVHAKAILESQYQCPPSLHELALEVGTNECTLKKAFKQIHGTSAFQYLLDFKMNHACCLLADTNKPIIEIAEQVGYKYNSHFAKAFKKRYGITPTEYRFKL